MLHHLLGVSLGCLLQHVLHLSQRKYQRVQFSLLVNPCEAWFNRGRAAMFIHLSSTSLSRSSFWAKSKSRWSLDSCSSLRHFVCILGMLVSWLLVFVSTSSNILLHPSFSLLFSFIGSIQSGNKSDDWSRSVYLYSYIHMQLWLTISVMTCFFLIFHQMSNTRGCPFPPICPAPWRPNAAERIEWHQPSPGHGHTWQQQMPGQTWRYHMMIII